MTSQTSAVFSLLAACVIAALIYFLTSSIATFVFALFFLIVGCMFTCAVCSKYQRGAALILFNIAFCFYLLVAANHYFGYEADWGLFTQDWLDEYKFYQMAEENKNLSIKQIFVDSFVSRKYLEYGGYVFYISSLATLANTYFDGNHLLLQFLGTAIFGVLTCVMLFKMLSLYVDEKKAFCYSLVFVFFSIFNSYSGSLLRDVPIAFLYSCGFYLILNSNVARRFLSVLLMLVLNFIVWELRFESGLFFSLMTLYLCFRVFRKNKLVLISIGFVASILFLVTVLSYMGKVVYEVEKYSSWTHEQVGNNQDSFGSYIYQLPPVIKQFGLIVNSQIQPFPSWIPLQSSENIHRAISGILQMVYSFFWFIVVFSLVSWLSLRKKYSLVRDELLGLSVICFLFLLFNTANMSARRIMAVYPFIYLVYVYVREHLSRSGGAVRETVVGIFVYLSLVLLYLIMKL